VCTVEEVKRAIGLTAEWQKLSQRSISKSVDQWHRRLELVLSATAKAVNVLFETLCIFSDSFVTLLSSRPTWSRINEFLTFIGPLVQRNASGTVLRTARGRCISIEWWSIAMRLRVVRLLLRDL